MKRIRWLAQLFLVLDSGAQIFRTYAVDMADGMMREKPRASMLAIAPNQNEFARIFMREVNEPYGKVFLKFFGLTHEHPEFMFLIRRPKSHFIPLHFAFKLHLTTWRINHFLTAGYQIGNVLLCEYQHVAYYAETCQRNPSSLCG